MLLKSNYKIEIPKKQIYKIYRISSDNLMTEKFETHSQGYDAKKPKMKMEMRTIGKTIKA